MGLYRKYSSLHHQRLASVEHQAPSVCVVPCTASSRTRSTTGRRAMTASTSASASPSAVVALCAVPITEPRPWPRLQLRAPCGAVLLALSEAQRSDYDLTPASPSSPHRRLGACRPQRMAMGVSCPPATIRSRGRRRGTNLSRRHKPSTPAWSTPRWNDRPLSSCRCSPRHDIGARHTCAHDLPAPVPSCTRRPAITKPAGEHSPSQSTYLFMC
jgi:hypothetical protein